jgi:hypothetical protein
MSRETITKLLQEVATENNINVDLRPGSPMYIYLVDLLAATLTSLLEQTAAAGVMDVNERADNFYVTDGASTPSEFTVRLYFWDPTTLQYAANTMSFTSGGSAYSNKFPVSWPSQNMAFYTDGVYYYYDVVLEGESPVASGTVLTFDSPPSSFSHVVISSITTGGSAAYSEDELEEAIRRELSLRNNVTRPGIVAYLSNLYGSELKDVLVQGFLDAEQNRDIYNNVHMGGYVDVYLKGGSPVPKTLKFDNVEDDDVEISAGCTICESSTLPQTHLTTFELRSWIRPAAWYPPLGYYVFTEGVDYTIGMETGAVSLLGIDMTMTHLAAGINVRTGGLVYGVVDDVQLILNRTFTFSGILDPANYVNVGHIVQLVSGAGIVLDNFIVNAVNSGFGGTFVVDHDVDLADIAATAMVYYLEPIRCVYDYNPIGAKLEDFDAPVLSLDSVTVLDPLTDEETTTEVPPMPGFGYGHFGGGGFGVGDSFGYFLHSFDELVRYSMRETGFLELPSSFELERVGCDYHTDTLISSAHTDLLENRARPADVLAFAFVPAITDFVCRVRSAEELNEAEISSMIWSMPGEIELSDVVRGLYELGATYVNIDDLFNASTYTVWSKDGVLSRVVPTSDGKLTLSSITERFLPRSITITYEE